MNNLKKTLASVLALLMILTCGGVTAAAQPTSALALSGSSPHTTLHSPYGIEVAQTTKNYAKNGLTVHTLGHLNTVDFKGTFEYGFPWDYTHEDTFHGTQSDLKVKFLHEQTYSCPYGSDGKFQGLGLPYSGTDYELYLLLPTDSKQDPTALWNSYSTEQKASFLSTITSKAMASVSIPRMKLQATSAINGYRQTVRLNVDETGTAPDRVRKPIQRPYCKIPPRIRLTFYANHPFYLLLKDNKTGKIIYEGAVMQL